MGFRVSWNSRFAIIKSYFIKWLTVMNLKWLVIISFQCYLYNQVASFEGSLELTISSLTPSWILWHTLKTYDVSIPSMDFCSDLCLWEWHRRSVQQSQHCYFLKSINYCIYHLKYVKLIVKDTGKWKMDSEYRDLLMCDLWRRKAGQKKIVFCLIMIR